MPSYLMDMASADRFGRGDKSFCPFCAPFFSIDSGVSP